MRAIRAVVRVHARLLSAIGGIMNRVTRWRDKDTASPSGRMHIVVLRLDELGDVVLTTPLLSELKHYFPDAYIEVVLRPAMVPLLRASTFADEISTFDPGGVRSLKPLVLPARAVRWWWHRRRRRPADIAINARPGPDAAYAGFLAQLTGAACRLGITEFATGRKAIYNAGFDRFYTSVVGSAAVTHDVDASLALLYPLGLARHPTYARLEPGHSVPDSLATARTNPRIALCVSGGHSVLKRWPVDRFAQLAERLHAQLGATIVVVGSRDDAALAAEIAWPVDTIDLAGRTSLDDLRSVLANVDLYVGGDIGPTHVAAALGTPAIALFGSSVPAVFSPRGRAVTVLWHSMPCNPLSVGATADGTEWDPAYLGAERCSTCIFDSPACMDAISVDEVFDAVIAGLRDATASDHADR